MFLPLLSVHVCAQAIHSLSRHPCLITAQMTNELPCVKDEFQSTTPVPPHQMKGLIASNCGFKMLNSSIKKPIYMN